MDISVRYYSRSGNTKAIAEAIADACGVKAVSVDSAEAVFSKADVLFIGGALYAYGLDENLNEYLDTLKKEDVKKAVIFSSTWISKHSIELIRKKLQKKGIEVAEESFYVRGKPSVKQLNEAKAFAERMA
ncbi:MAG: hypothetical protein K5908_06185 [Erysipelotrichaceae bacterium]|nr:hypothetical protein [Erysipelotrichaceae bacterium]